MYTGTGDSCYYRSITVTSFENICRYVHNNLRKLALFIHHYFAIILHVSYLPTELDTVAKNCEVKEFGRLV
jgi:hypothetical protein